MAHLKLTSWNIKHLGRLLPTPESSLGQRRLDAIVQQIGEVDPDILCIVEGPGAEAVMQGFADNQLGGAYRLIASEDGQYGMKGTQWIWFLVKDELAAAASLVPVAVWKALAGKKWNVHYWGSMEEKGHSHYRHPQVMALTVNGIRVEFIGLHLKSKFNKKKMFDDAGNLNRVYVDEALKARIKLATEAANVRRYIDARFGQTASPAIFVMGDLNDGPGKELFERQYLFFDLLSNLQGEVFFAQRFLNHALFDFPQQLRWSAFFKDKVDPERDPHILLDHILFTQPLVNGSLPVWVEPGAGLVEHEVHDRINAILPKRSPTSDHKPVFVVITTEDA